MPDTPLNPDAVEAMSRVMNPPAWSVIERYPEDELVIMTKEAELSKAEKLARAYVAVAQPEVNSAEELDALPVGSLIMMRGVVAPFLHTDDGWESTRTPGKPVRDYTTNPSYLPARVLYRPEVNDA